MIPHAMVSVGSQTLGLNFLSLRVFDDRSRQVVEASRGK